MLLQFPLDFFCQIQVLSDYGRGLLGELLNIGIAPVFRFFLEIGQVLLVILYHSIHIILIGFPPGGLLLSRQLAQVCHDLDQYIQSALMLLIYMSIQVKALSA